MKTNAIIRIILWSIVLVVLVGLLLSFSAGQALYKTRRTGVNLSPDSGETGSVTAPGDTDLNSTSVPADQVRELSIEWAAGDIRIIPVEGIDQIQIHEEAVEDPEYRMVCKTYGNALKISFSEDISGFSGLGITVNTQLSKDLTIQVPADWTCDSLEMDIAAANLKLYGLTVGELDVDGASGTCYFSDCLITDLDLDTASGDVTFSGSLDTLDFDAASASFTGVFENIPKSIDMDGMSGNLDITLPEDAGFTVSMDGMSREFTSDFETTMNNGSYVCGDGRCRINMDGMSCDLYIRKHAQHHEEAADCTDETCTDESHNHAWLCTDETCADESHNHAWLCTDENCTDTTHNHVSSCVETTCTDESHNHKEKHHG